MSSQPEAVIAHSPDLDGGFKRAYAIDIETCPECGGTLRVIACTRHGFTRALLRLRPNRILVFACAEEPLLIAKILRHVERREELNGSLARAPTVAFTADNWRSTDLASRLSEFGLGVGAGHFYAYRLVEALGIDTDDGVVRTSFVHYTRPEEVTRLIEALDTLLQEAA